MALSINTLKLLKEIRIKKQLL